MSNDGERHYLGKVVMFDLRGADNPSDKKIEALVQSLLSRVFKQAELRDLSFEEAGCALLEAAARFLSAPALARSDPPEHSAAFAALAEKIGGNLALRMVDCAKRVARTGKDDIGETAGNA
jgi:hypothetical protein